MIAKQIEAPGVELTYDVNGRLDSVTTEIQACYMYPTIVAKYVLDEDRDGSNKSRLTLTLAAQVTVLSQQATDKLESYLATIRHLRPGAEEANTELQVSPDNSKETVEISKALLKEVLKLYDGCSAPVNYWRMYPQYEHSDKGWYGQASAHWHRDVESLCTELEALIDGNVRTQPATAEEIAGWEA